MKSCDPTTSWRRLTCRLTVGWLVLVISAARLNDLVLATARKTRSSPQNCPLKRVSSSSGLLLSCCSSSNGSMVSPVGSQIVCSFIHFEMDQRGIRSPLTSRLNIILKPVSYSLGGLFNL